MPMATALGIPNNFPPEIYGIVSELLIWETGRGSYASLSATYSQQWVPIYPTYPHSSTIYQILHPGWNAAAHLWLEMLLER